MRSLVRLPKAHLHLRLEGAMRPGTFTELTGERPPDARDFTSFEDFAALYGAAARLVREVIGEGRRAAPGWVSASAS